MNEEILQGNVSKNMNVTVVLQREENGTVLAECRELPGCSVIGEDENDAITKIQAAVEGCLDTLLMEMAKVVEGKRVLTAGQLFI